MSRVNLSPILSGTKYTRTKCLFNSYRDNLTLQNVLFALMAEPCFLCF